MNKQKRIGRKMLCLIVSFVMVMTLIPRMPAGLAYAEDIYPEETQLESTITDVQDTADEDPMISDEEEAEEPAETSDEAELQEQETAAEEPADQPEADTEEPADVVDETAAEPEGETQAEPSEEEVVDDAEEVNDVPLATEPLTAKGKHFSVKVTYGPEAGIPEGATLKMTEFSKGSKGFEDAKEALIKEDNGLEEGNFGMAAFDLTIYDKDGNAVEPLAPVQVDFEMNKLPEGADAEVLADTMEVQHHNESTGEVVIETVATVDASEAAKDQAVGEISVDQGEETAEAAFTVDGFSTYTVTWWQNGNRSATVHYGYMNGNQFVEFSNGTPSYTPTYNGNRAFLIYDVPGYEYDSTHLNSATGTAIRPILNVQNNNHQYTTSTGNDNANWQNFSNGDDIYVVYKAKKDPTTGGETAPIDPTQQTWPNEIPSLVKNSTNNGNGTNTISLRITGPEKTVESGGKADIIVVFDRSGSMSDPMSGSNRLQLAKNAINDMIDNLMSTTNDNIRMGLVQFSTTGSVVQDITGDPETMHDAVDGLTASGGTNWEQALYEANHMNVATDRPTFVVFVTDGDPTFRISRGEVSDSDLDMYTYYDYRYYRQNQVYGTGSSDNSGRNFDFAVEEVKNIVAANKNFYAVGVSNDVTKVQTLCTDAGVASNHAFLASQSEDLEEAFQTIIEAIKTQLGYGDIKINDGITSMTSVEMKALQEIDPGSFKYYRFGGENNKYGNGYANKTEWTPAQMEAAKCEPATYVKETGDVKWNMGDDFQLENGVTYIVEFEAWPSQEAYDLVADLNNGLKDYDSLPAETKAQIKKLDNGEYTLLTNVPGSVGATYAQTHKTGDDVTVTTTTGSANYTESIENLNLDEETIKAVKEWNNELDGRTAAPVTLIVNKDGAEYYKNDPKTTVSADTNWTTQDIYISCGFIKQEGTPLQGGSYEVKEVGHDYTIDEPENLAYYWDLSSEDYRPMAINGVAHILYKVDSVETGWVDGKDYFMIDNKIYKVDDQHNTIKAVNDRRSYLDLTKVLENTTGADLHGPFKYEITVGADGDDDIWFSVVDYNTVIGTDPETGDPIYATVMDLDVSDNVTAEVRDGAKTGYYYVEAGDTFNVSIEDGWNLRFINLLTGTEYTIKEVDLGDEYAFVEAEATATGPAGTTPTPATITGMEAAGTIDKANTEYKVTYTNKVTAATEEPKVSKALTGRQWQEGDSFTFELTGVADSEGNMPPMPSRTADGKKTVEATSADEVSFGTIPFGKTGTYTYIIKEVAGDEEAMIYDTSEHKFVVTVTKNAAGDLVATGVYDPKEDGTGGSDSLTITNTYKEATANIKATKVFAAWNDGRTDSFDITLTAKDGAPMPAGVTGTTVTMPATKDQPTVDFGTISYNEAKTYKYTVKETVPQTTTAGITYSEVEYDVEVVVSKGDDGLTAQVVYKNGEETINGIEITNTFTPTSESIDVTKLLVDEEGNAVAWEDDDEFTFTLTATGGAPMPTAEGGNTVTVTKDAQTGSFGAITFDAVGEYTYQITETQGNKDGVTYDTAPKTITVSVTKGTNNELVATVNYDEGKESVEITNVFKPTTAEPEVTKAINDWGTAESFTFELAPVTANAPMPARTTDGKKTITINKGESLTKGFGDITFEKAGEYRYTITEIDDHVPGVTYDTTAHTVVVTVSRDTETNELSAVVKYDDETSLTITNHFSSTNATLQATKSVVDPEGNPLSDWGDAEDAEFTFTLTAVDGAPMPAEEGGDTVTVTKDDRTGEFGEIEYKATGTYTYKITEAGGTVGGMTYDTSEHTAVVIVGVKDGTQDLEVKSIKYDGEDALVIKNVLTPVKVNPEATKEIEDWGTAESFTFELAPVTANAPMPAGTTGGKKSVTVTKGGDLTAVFGEIEFNKAGEYEYTITEVDDGIDGITYDTTAHEVVVTVSKNADTNALTATITYDGEESLTITNTFTPATAEPEATKAIEDWGTAESFTFELAPVTENAPMPAGTADGKKSVTVTKGGNLTAAFGEIEFNKAGEYEYTITEVNDRVDGITYDATAHKVVVSVEKGKGNVLTATITYDGKESLTITNTFTPTEITPEATKQIEDWGTANRFTFTLEGVADADGNMPPMPASGGETATATRLNTTAVFGTIEYDKAGTYNYTITEVNGGVDGITYDTTPHNVVVTVTKGEDNALSASIKYDDNAASLTITNTFTPATAEPEVTKAIEDWGTAESFTFELAPVTENAPMPAGTTEGKKSVTVTKGGDLTAAFGEIEFNKAGEYEYTITEVNGGVDGVTYDTTPHNVVVTVSKEDGTNKLTATITYDEKESLTITNTFTPAEITPEATKEFEDWGKADSFTFTLAGVEKDGVMPPMPASGGETATATRLNTTAVFGTIEYDKAGTYNYTITEVNDGADGVTYDTEAHEVVVTVTKNDETNALTATITYDGGESLTITNTYEPTTAPIEVTKAFDRWDLADSFEFTLAGVADSEGIMPPMPEETTATATENAKTASFGNITFEAAGTYSYTITETNGGVDGVSYDTAPHNVTVTVTKDPDTNELSADVKYDGTNNSLTITNTYKSATANIKATKNFNDWGQAESFTFNLAAVTSGAPMPKDADGNDVTQAVATRDNVDAIFGDIVFETAGTYEYTITEVDDGVDGVTYDTTPHKVTVEVVKEEGTNKLTASVTYNEEDAALVITNTFEPSNKVTLQATKAFDRWDLAENFTFNLAGVADAEGNMPPMPKDEDGNEVTSVTATETSPTAVFGEVSFKKAGEYKYTITEVDDGVDGVTYDTTAHEVVVTVAKGEGNKLTATVKYDGAESLTITNTFTPVTAAPEVTKEFNDWGKASSFTFTLEGVEDADGNIPPMPAAAGTTATATKDDPLAVFGDITFEKAGTYNYTITEQQGSADGVTYDTTPHPVTVTVTKGEGNALSASITYDGEESLTITNTYEPTTAEIEVTKIFDRWDLASSFTFTLAGVEDADGKMPPMPEETTATATETAKTASFGDITFEAAGTYEYTITETDDHVPGVTYDTTAHKVKVVVTRDPDTNELSTAVTYDDDQEALEVTNTFKGVKVQPEVTKEMNDWTKDGEFTFTLAATSDGAPMPKEGEEIATATEDEPLAQFGEITYDKTGTYTYTITETNDGNDGVAYDTTAHTVTVTVEKAEDSNALTASIKYDGENSLTVTNTFTPVTAAPEVTKEFNDWGKASSFTFTLAGVEDADGNMPPMPAAAGTTATATKDDPLAVFGDITFEKAGTYNYTITEVNGGADGVTYDTEAHEVVVTVTKDADTNALSTSITYDGEESLTITNTYEPTTAEIEVTKIFDRWDLADSFTFTLAGVEKDGKMPPMPEETTATATETAKTASFGDITYEAAGTYEYTITERDDHVPGVTYDTTAHKVKVVVTKDPDTNELSTAVTYDDDQEKLEVTNTFKGVKVQPEVTKEMNDWTKDGEFTFTLAATSDGAPMPKEGEEIATATEDKPLAQFGEITYDKTGTYTYTITETNDGNDGVAYDTTAHTVVVTVEKAEDSNALTASIKYGGEDSLTVTNTFTPVKAEIKTTKDFDYWGKASSFTFTLKGVADDEGNMPPMPGKTTATATETAKVASFGEITFVKAGTYEYIINEIDDEVDGVTYDTSDHKVVVTVTKDKDTNALSAEVKYDDGTSLTVSNSFTAAVETLQATKEFNEWGLADEFRFVLAGVADKDGKMPPMPEETEATATQADAASFGPIEYDKAGTYEYTITEIDDGVPGVTYDTTPHKVVVTVTKGEKNALSTSVVYDEDSEALTVKNTHTPVEVQPEVTKKFNRWDLASSFTFTIAGVEDAEGNMPPMPANTTAVATEDEPLAVFDTIAFKEVGEYKYTITETNDGIDGVSYDVNPHEVVVTVTKAEDSNKLLASVKYDGDDSLEVTNTFTPVKDSLEATKEFNDWGKASSFTFTLAAVTDNAPMPDEPVQTATEAQKTAVWEDLTFEKAGTYVYTITETNDGVDGVSYDVTPHNVTVTVAKADDATNALSIESITYDDGTELIVTNTFTPAVVDDVEVTKELTGRDWYDDDKFEFELKAVTEGAPMPAETKVTATKDDPTAVFGEITYDKAGTYEYTITEINGKYDGVAYDVEPHKVTVTVEKAEDATNALTATVTYDEEATSLTITNEFTPAEASIDAEKEFASWDKAGEFKFELTAVTKDAPLPEETVLTVTEKEPTVTFGDIEFVKAGTYEYEVTELEGDLEYVIYDTTPHKVTVTVTKADDATNKLTAEVTYEDNGKDVKIFNELKTYPLKITKMFDGIHVKRIPADFYITVKYEHAAGKFTEKRLTLDDAVVSEDGKTFEWIIEEVLYGSKVELTEANQDVIGYIVTDNIEELGLDEFTIGTDVEKNRLDVINTYEPNFGDLRINKKVSRYDTVNDTTFVYSVVATYDDNGTEVKVYDDVVSIDFSEGGEKYVEIIGKIPVGSKVTVTEIYTTGSYEVVGDDSFDVEIKADEKAVVNFENTYNDNLNQGYGILNEYTNDGDKWNHNTGNEEEVKVDEEQ